MPKRCRKDKRTDIGQRDQGAYADGSSIASQHNADHSQAIANMVRAQLGVPALTTSSIPGSSVNGKVKEVEEIGPEEVVIEKAENAEVLIPEEQEKFEIIEEIPREPERQVVEVVEDELEEASDDDDDDDFDDETILERIAALTEMFPKGTIHILRKHLYSTKLNVTTFFVKTKEFRFSIMYILQA